jgi:hypothetical protein
MPLGHELARERRPPRPEITLPDPAAGTGLMRAAVAATALLAVTTALGAIAPHALAVPALIVALAMFFGGTAALLWSYLLAIGRSRELQIDVAGLYALSGSAPKRIRVVFLGSVAAQVAIAVGGIAVRPRSSLAFGFLAVMWGIGLTGLWGARHGSFPARAPGAGRSARRT